MRVKLSYTVDEEDVLKEAAKLLQLASDDMGQVLSLYTGVQAELKGREEAGGVPNTALALEMIGEFRKALLYVDTRLNEIVEIVEGYEAYVAGTRAENTIEALQHSRPHPYDDHFGSD